MVNITRYSPLEDAFENLFRGLPVWLPNSETRAPAPTQFRMDVTENDKGYQVLAELPGVKKEDIDVAIEGNQVTITAQVKQEWEKKEGDRMLRNERYFGNIYRGFTLPVELDETACDATYENGVLELKLVRKAAAPGKRLAIR